VDPPPSPSPAWQVALLFPERFWPLGAAAVGLPNGGSPSRPAFQCYDGGGALPVTRPSSSGSGGGDNAGCITFFALAQDEANAAGAGAVAATADGALAKRCAAQLASAWASHGLQAQAARLTAAVDAAVESAAVATASSGGGEGGGGAAVGGGSGACAFAVQRWPAEPFVADDPAPTELHAHPQPVRALGAAAWDGTLLFAGTEADARSPGVMEGAVGAAKAALRLVR
jgi:hypothetical protein